MVRHATNSTHPSPRRYPITFLSRVVIALAAGLVPLLAFLPGPGVQASPLMNAGPVALVSQDEGGVWRLVSSDNSDTWKGDKFHGLESEYSPIYNNNTLGAVYTQYNIAFDANSPRTISQQLTGTCTWDWGGGALPLEVVAGQNYPFDLTADVSVTGSNPMMSTVNAYIETVAQGAQKGQGIAFVQAFLDPMNTADRSAQNQGSAALVFPAGASEGEERRLNLSCAVDIVTVSTHYVYRWSKSSCTAMLALPDKMEKGKSFLPVVSVVDNNNQPVKPKKETWYYNGVSTTNMVWDGKAATVEYEYVCPLETTPKRAKLSIPALQACTATLTLPDKMEPGKQFQPLVSVVDANNQPVTPKSETWYYNGNPAQTLVWDGKAATVDYEFVCPVNDQTLRLTVTIPPQPGGTNWILVVGGIGAVLGAAAIAAGAAILAAAGFTKGAKPQPSPEYILQVSQNALDVRPKDSVPLTIQAWRITPLGPPVPAPEAAIQVSLPEANAGLIATPATGQGRLVCNFSVPRPSECAVVPVTVTAIAAGKTAQTMVQVRIVPLYALELRWNDPYQKTLKPGDKPAWAYAEVTATPVDPASPVEQWTRQISFSLQGPNIELVQFNPPAPVDHDQKKMVGLIAARPPARPGVPALLAWVTAGSQRLEASLPILLSQGYELTALANGKPETEARYQRKFEPEGWDFGEIVAFFSEKGDYNQTPVQPDFPYTLDRSGIHSDPPVLEVSDFNPDGADHYTIKVKLKDGVDLGTYFKFDPDQPQESIKVTITASGEQGQPYPASIRYRLCPGVTFCAQSYDANPAIRGGHTYRQASLGEMEFVTNGDDSLRLAGYFIRSDQAGNAKPGLEQRLDVGEITGSDWLDEVDNTDFGEPQPEAFAAEDHFARLELKSEGPLEATPDRLNADHTLVFHLALNEAFSARYSLDTERVEVKVNPQYLRLRMWVVPGMRRHTSEAVAYLELMPSRRALGDQEVYLQVESPGGISLNFDECKSMQTTYPQGTPKVCGPGAAEWTLRYSGMTWTNLHDADFTVRAGLEDPPDSRWNAEYSFNVYKNMRGMLGSITDEAIGATDFATKINNPDLKSGLLFRAIMANPGMMISESVSRNLYGPIWNISNLFQAREYVCSDLRNKVIEWLMNHRFYQKGEHVTSAVVRLGRMNGIDFGHYAIVPAHVWAGVFPAGAPRFSEYRALDPWWCQAWEDDWRYPENLWTQNDEDIRAGIFKTFNAVLAAALVSLMPAIEAVEAIKLVNAYLNGTPPAELARMAGRDIADWFRMLLVDSDCVTGDVEVYNAGVIGVAAWFKKIIKE